MNNTKVLYAIVEGFFSNPLPVWSISERLDTLKFITQYGNGINTYYYCPKDDQFVTNKWDQIYPEDKLNELKSVVDYCIKENIEFIYGLNPLVINAEDLLQKSFKDRIIQKLKQMQGIGVRSFSLLFDDLPVAYDVVSNTIGDEEKLLSYLIRLVNEVYKEIPSNKFLFCGPDYCFNNINPLNSFVKELSSGIGVVWSGNAVFSNIITDKDVKRVKSIVGKERGLVLWLNYPVNDCEQSIGTFNLGGFPEMLNTVYQYFDGIVVNPMRECYANLPLYLTFSDFIDKKENYSRVKAWKNALQFLFDNNAKEFGEILDTFSSRNIIDNRLNVDTVFGMCTLNTLQESRKVIKKMQNYNSNKWGKLFIKSIDLLIKVSDSYISVFTNILNGKEVSKALFEEISRFPTNISRARYLNEILNIVKYRLSLLPKGQKTLFNNEFEGLEIKAIELTKKYKGKQVLKIRANDEKVMLDMIQALINFESKYYLSFINNNGIAFQEKLKILGERQYANRFTI